jgi:hypothetical protein
MSQPAYHHALGVPEKAVGPVNKSLHSGLLLHHGALITVLTASRWYASKGIRCGLTRHSKGHWEITPRTGESHG